MDSPACLVGSAVAQPHPLHYDRADAGLHLAFWSVTVPD